MTATHDIGARLRRAREQRGLTLRDLAGQTKLSMIALRAIERNDFGALPGGLYPRAYVRMLACELGLDASELAREYVEQFELEPVAEPPPRRQGLVARIRDRCLSVWPSPALREKSKVRP